MLTLSPSHQRIIPFAVFMAFIAVEEGMRLAARLGGFTIPLELSFYIYPLKALSAAIALWIFRNGYHEIVPADVKKMKYLLISSATGTAVFILWINMGWTLPGQNVSAGFNPLLITDPLVRSLIIATRLAGAVIIVPLIEELFWRSFLLRYLIQNEFTKVPVGTFTLFSFIVSAILFGLEHNFVVAGIAAGACYNILLYYTKSITHCIIAHAVTNLLLGLYVLVTGNWFFW